ncbi:MAG: hypothetical protein R3C28_03800 [Pirellulaceae bacterium]
MSNESDVVVALDESLAQEFSNYRQQPWQAWVDDLPSWLTSLVFHLSICLLITALAGKPTSRSGSQAIELTLGSSVTDDREESGDDVQIAQSEPVTLADQETGSNQTSLDERARPVEQPLQASHAQSRPASAPRFMDMTVPSRSKPYAALLRPSRSSSVTSGAFVVTNKMITPQAEGEMDAVVDNFILYDIGKLRGAEGQRARTEFMKLGPEAVPALVRGLNKSASIHASCPVGVIAGKLMSVLQQGNQGSSVRYAREHIGEGVPQSAPHYHRILVLRDRWLDNLRQMPDKIASVLEQQGMEGNGAAFELALSLAESPASTMIVALGSTDDQLRTPAMIALLERHRTLDANQLRQARRSLESGIFQQAPDSEQAQALVDECRRIFEQADLRQQPRARRSRPEIRNMPKNAKPTYPLDAPPSTSVPGGPFGSRMN